MPRNEKATVETIGETLVFRFASGEVIEASLNEVEPMVRRLALHGLEQKLRDSYAGCEPGEAYAYAMATWERLLTGEWSKRREGEPKEDSLDLLVRATENAIRAAGKPVPENLRAKIEALDRSARAKLRASQPVAIELAKLRAPKQGALESILGLEG